jgi:hypothetical protein
MPKKTRAQRKAEKKELDEYFDAVRRELTATDTAPNEEEFISPNQERVFVEIDYGAFEEQMFTHCFRGALLQGDPEPVELTPWVNPPEYASDMQKISLLRKKLQNESDPRKKERYRRRIRSVSNRCVAPTLVARFGRLSRYNRQSV